MKKKLIRISTMPASLGGLLRGQLKFMTDHFEVIGISSSGGENTTKIDRLDYVGEAQNIRVIPVKMTRSITPLQDLRATWQLYMIFKREKPFIVHSHTPKAGTLGMLAAYLARVPHRLHTVAGLPLIEVTGIKRTILDIVEKITYSCATKLYPNSFGLKQIIIKNKYAPSRKLKVIGNGSSNGIDTDFFNPELYDENAKQRLKSELGIGKDDFVYLFIGRLVTDKGINELVQAFKRINVEYPDTKLLLVGSQEMKLDPLLPETEDILLNHPNIIAVGSQSEVRPYYAISDALAFPSYREGFPNVVMEAGAMGLPSIVSDINGCNEIIIENQNGFIIPVKNMEQLYNRMKTVYVLKEQNNPFKADVIRKMISSRFARKVIWNELLLEYQNLAGE
jgi:glycosyltransferase involved in cell wall biosynthesis